jgi:hypothetical protein
MSRPPGRPAEASSSVASLRRPRHYGVQVFINCPFDTAYQSLFDAIVFAVLDCGFVARSAMEIADSSEVRIAKICRIIAASKFAIHDLSRTEPDELHQLPRFNMPLELGIFLGAKAFGGPVHHEKNCIIMDREPFRYQKFISDIAGQDIRSHADTPEKAVTEVRDWLRSSTKRKTIPGGSAIWQRFLEFSEQLPTMCVEAQLRSHELTFNDRTHFIENWLVAVGRPLPTRRS